MHFPATPRARATCVTEVRRILAPDRAAPAMRFTTQVPLANTTLYAPPPPPDPKAKAPPPAAKVEAVAVAVDPSDHSIPLGNLQLELLSDVFDMQKGLNSVDKDLFALMYHLLGPESAKP